jgi:hypothetical protein
VLCTAVKRLAAVIRMVLIVGVVACPLAFAADAASADGTDPACPGSTLHMSVTGPLRLAATAKLRGHALECIVTAKNSLGSTTATSRPLTLH